MYDDDSLAEDLEADMERMGEELAQRGLARNAVIPDPDDVEDNLNGLTEFSFDVDEHVLATRFGAGSVRVLCYYVDTAGNRWLDPECTVEFPEQGTGREGRFTMADCRDLVPARSRCVWVPGRVNSPRTTILLRHGGSRSTFATWFLYLNV